MKSPAPLAPGWVLDDRFEIVRLLGRGGFGIAYLARDLTRGDNVVVKELAPLGVPRRANGTLELESGPQLQARFLKEAAVLRSFQHPGIPALWSTFAENGTAYYVTVYLPGARTLDDRMRRDGNLSEEAAREIFVSLLDVLEVIHAAGVLHRDIKPSNVLLGPAGEVVLIDFGAARDWIPEAAVTHTVMHTPGYAPPEQLSERAQRGPGTDLYGLCATIYHSLTGRPPATAGDRLAGLELIPLAELRPGLDESFCRAVEAGLAARLADRPNSAEEMRELLRDDAPMDTSSLTVERIDDTLVRLASFRYDRRGCPNCDGILEDLRPLRKGVCPVCAEGIVRRREFDERRCPLCRVGHLERRDNSGPLFICPSCSLGRLATKRKSLLSLERTCDCPACGAHFDIASDGMWRGEEFGTFAEWRQKSGRSIEIWDCPSCEAQFDLLADGRWAQAAPRPDRPRHYYPEEWARLAAGLSPGAGNAWCEACDADYWQEDQRITLLDAPTDPRGFAARYLGQALGVEDVRWLGVGKTSGEPGLICDACETEFDRYAEYQRLVFSPNRRLRRHLGEPRVLEDWHRIAHDLPTIDQAGEYEAAFEPALRQAYIDGSLSFDDQGTTWRGKARYPEEEGFQTLTITDRELIFGGAFRKWRMPVDAILRAEAEGDLIYLAVSGESEELAFEVLPLELVAHLRSGRRSFEVTAEDLAARLSQKG